MKQIKSFFKGLLTLISTILTYFVVIYTMIVGLPAILVVFVAALINPNKVKEPKLTKEQLTERINKLTEMINERGLSGSLKVDANAKLIKR